MKLESNSTRNSKLESTLTDVNSFSFRCYRRQTSRKEVKGVLSTSHPSRKTRSFSTVGTSWFYLSLNWLPDIGFGTAVGRRATQSSGWWQKLNTQHRKVSENIILDLSLWLFVASISSMRSASHPPNSNIKSGNKGIMRLKWMATRWFSLV